ncbi:putative deoxyribonuclease RhsC [compost metagenome]
MTAEWDALGREIRYEYHPGLHLVSRRINPDGSELKYRYDNAKLFLSEIENEHGEQHRIHYFPNGLVARETGFDGRTTAYRYDLNGQLSEKVEFGKQETELVTRYERDPMGRLLKKTLPDGREIQFSYDQYGQLTQVDNGAWPLTFEYDTAGNLLAEHQGWASSYFKHDDMGRLAHWQLPDGNQLAYHYLHGELSGIDLNGAELTRHQRVGGLEMRRSQGALTQQYEYDEQGRLTALRLQRGKQVARERRYGYDSTGNLLQINDSVQGEQRYRYDPLDRLLEVRGELTERFLHDPAGNLLSQTLGGQFDGARTQGNRLLLSGDRHFEYDEFGRLAIERRGKGQSLVTRYHYDCQHQLVRAELPDGTTARYDYDAFGRRIRKTVGRANGELVTEFLWQANNLIAESSYQLGDDKRRTDEQYRSFIYEPGSFKPLVQLEGEGTDTEVFHYQLDHLGTPLALTRDNGATAWQVRYRAYGNVWREEIAEVATPLRFQGQYFDAETGLHYNRYRYYQPETGRFITPDPIGLAGGLNNYQYAPNPTGWVDPLGLKNVKENGPNNIDGKASPSLQGGPEEPPSVGQSKPDFYVGPSGPDSTLPSTGYRYDRYLNDDGSLYKYGQDAINTGEARLSYFGFDKLDTGDQVTEAFQIRAPKHVTMNDPDKSWSDGRLRIKFDTLQLYDGSGVPRVEVPRSHGGKGPDLEPFTEAYPEYGKGGARQLVPNTDESLYIKADAIDILPKE